MKKINITTITEELPATLSDIITPVSLYLRLRDVFPKTILLESSDYHGSQNSMSYICFQQMGRFSVNNFEINYEQPGEEIQKAPVTKNGDVSSAFQEYMNSFKVKKAGDKSGILNGLFGYTSFDAIQYFEDIRFGNEKKEEYAVPDLYYAFYKYIIAIDHFNNKVTILENLVEDEKSRLYKIKQQLFNRNIGQFQFNSSYKEYSNISNEEYMQMVTKGKKHCFRGDVFQIVLSRQFSQKFTGDEFNVYRALRSINPSPYLFYFDFGNFKIFGSSPEAQLIIEKDKAVINPIAGTFKRTGDDESDRQLAEKLTKDPKENAEHVMLVDLARNDLSRNSKNVTVETYREVQYYSHVLHLVSKVTGVLPKDYNAIQVMGDSFPAGTLSGAPKYKAMELIDKYENQNRGYYGGCIGYIGFDKSFNQAIMIRTFLSKDNTLFYQAGAGIVSESVEESELNEVNNKLAALKNAILLANEF